jgi:hypothetical protein
MMCGGERWEVEVDQPYPLETVMTVSCVRGEQAYLSTSLHLRWTKVESFRTFTWHA